MRAPILQQRDILRIASDVIEEGRQMPADAALRRLLKGRGFSQPEKFTITRLVFAYYRWLRWVEEIGPGHRQLERALELQEAFAKDPGCISDEELVAKAVPEWVHEQARMTAETLREFQQEPRLWLRSRRGAAKQVAEELANCKRQGTVPDAFWYRGNADLFQTDAFRAGLFEIQDLSSQCVGHVCAARPGETWWDACAGEGGKTLHLADQMENRGMIWATDRAEWRLEKLKRRAARARIFNYRVKHWANPAHLPIKSRVDGLLLDAPCSGIGTWGRNPHMRWTVTAQDVAELAEVQLDLLGRTAALVKPGGRVIYSVCTLSEAETVGVTRRFEEAHPEFSRMTLVNPTEPGTGGDELWLWPAAVHANGMYVGAWQKK